ISGLNGKLGTGITTVDSTGSLSFTANTDASSTQVIDNGIVNANQLSLSIGSLSGTGTVILNTTLLTLGNLNLPDVFSGSISGTGSLTKIGTGTLTLSGNNSYSGNTDVQAGTLVVDGSGTLGSVLGTVSVEGILKFINNATDNNAINN